MIRNCTDSQQTASVCTSASLCILSTKITLLTVTKLNFNASLSDGFQVLLLYISLYCIVEYFTTNMHTLFFMFLK